MTPLETDVLAEVTPTAEEKAVVEADAKALVAACDARLAAAKLPGKASVQGSIAKGTWLKGGADIDLFLLLDPSVPVERLEAAALDVGPHVLSDVTKKYAQHPYLMGKFRGRAVDLVPAYAVAEAGAKMSAVDRTPFHTAWVLSHLGDHKRAQVRLAKRWMKGTGVYGAQTAIGGFSGYLVEVLVARFLSFDGILGWLAGDAQPRRIVLPGTTDQVTDEVVPLVVVDPVDPGRNCAAAVSPATLRQAIAAAKAYRGTPSRRFFFPAAPRSEHPDTLRHALEAQDAAWAGALLLPKTERLDIVFPQFQKAARTLETGLEAAGFTVRRLDVGLSDDERGVFVQVVTDGAALPDRRLHRGPIDDGRPNAARFREKWENHPEALGPLRRGADGKLEVELAVRLRTPAHWLAARLPLEPLGRHVQDALDGHRTFADPSAVPATWAPRVADVVLDRKPWER